MSARVDVLVVGAGVIGLSVALELLRAGRMVTVIDREGPGAGASWGNCGTLTPSHAPPLAAPGMLLKALRWLGQADAPLLIRPRLDLALLGWLIGFARRCNRRDWRAASAVRAGLLRASMDLLRENLHREGLDCGFAESGLLYVFRDGDALAAEAAASAELAEFGIAAELLSREALLAREPALREDVVIGGIAFPGDACLRPDRLVLGLADRILALGGRIESGHALRGLRREQHGLLADGGNQVFTAREVIIATGAWSPLLLRGLGLRLPMQPGKGYSITMSRPALAPRQPLVLKERSVCVTTWADGFRLGSTMEFAGYDDSLNPVRLNALRRAAQEYLREPEGEETLEQWYGWRPMMVDDLPVIGAVPGLPGAWLATGHGMLGVSMSAVSGRLLADLLLGREPIVDPAPLSPLRFG